eukprot:4238483-Lingulodinium_polyedra.AAC.1
MASLGRPCNKGPVPPTNGLDLECVLRQHIEKMGTINLFGYENKQAKAGVDGCALVMLKDFLLAMIQIQPAA